MNQVILYRYLMAIRAKNIRDAAEIPPDLVEPGA